MALMYARFPYPEPIEKGVKLVMSRQRPVGSLIFLIIMLIELMASGRMVRGPKKPSKEYSTKHALSPTPISSFHFRFGCWVRRIGI